MNVLQSYLNRVVAVATVVLSVGAALLPVLADLDLASTAGVIAGILAVVTTSVKWLDGWQKAEASERLERTVIAANISASPPDVGARADELSLP